MANDDILIPTREGFAKLFPAVRGYQRYSSEQRTNLQSSHRQGYKSRNATGEVYWTHPACPNICFPTRRQALDRAYAVHLKEIGASA